MERFGDGRLLVMLDISFGFLLGFQDLYITVYRSLSVLWYVFGSRVSCISLEHMATAPVRRLLSVCPFVSPHRRH
jgi:hypothetical protein